jgi:hypothetical protein
MRNKNCIDSAKNNISTKNNNLAKSFCLFQKENSEYNSFSQEYNF